MDVRSLRPLAPCVKYKPLAIRLSDGFWTGGRLKPERFSAIYAMANVVDALVPSVRVFSAIYAMANTSVTSVQYVDIFSAIYAMANV